MSDLPPRWLDPDDAARYLGLRTDAFLRRVKARTLPNPSLHLGARTPRWDREALDSQLVAGAASEAPERPYSKAVHEILAEGRNRAHRPQAHGGRVGKRIPLPASAQRAR